jgi:hypothetical protein
MSSMPQKADPNTGDALIDEVRSIRRSICDQFGNDVDRLFDHLLGVEQDYAARRGAFAGVTREAAARVAEGWGEQAHRTDDPIVDEVRAIRRGLAGKEP